MIESYQGQHVESLDGIWVGGIALLSCGMLLGQYSLATDSTETVRLPKSVRRKYFNNSEEASHHYAPSYQ
jgi:hypothetical protein